MTKDILLLVLSTIYFDIYITWERVDDSIGYGVDIIAF